MPSTVKKFSSILISIPAFCLLLELNEPTWAQSVESPLGKNKTATAAENITNIESESDLSSNENSTDPNRVDQVGEKVAKQVDDLTQKASSSFGAWINTKVFYGISWLKLILCFLLLFMVLLIERMVRMAIDRRIKAMAERKEVKPIRHIILESIARPLSLFIWVYGIYLVLTPLFLHFRGLTEPTLCIPLLRKRLILALPLRSYGSYLSWYRLWILSLKIGPQPPITQSMMF